MTVCWKMHWSDHLFREVSEKSVNFINIDEKMAYLGCVSLDTVFGHVWEHSVWGYSRQKTNCPPPVSKSHISIQNHMGNARKLVATSPVASLQPLLVLGAHPIRYTTVCIDYLLQSVTKRWYVSPHFRLWDGIPYLRDSRDRLTDVHRICTPKFIIERLKKPSVEDGWVGRARWCTTVMWCETWSCDAKLVEQASVPSLWFAVVKDQKNHCLCAAWTDECHLGCL